MFKAITKSNEMVAYNDQELKRIRKMIRNTWCIFYIEKKRGYGVTAIRAYGPERSVAMITMQYMHLCDERQDRIDREIEALKNIFK